MDPDGNPSQRSVPLVVVYDQPAPCPYLPDCQSRMPLEYPLSLITEAMLDELLDLGYRRSGNFYYKTHCDPCDECKPTRVPLARFTMTASMRRVLSRGDRDLHIQFGAPQFSDQRLDLYNLHRLQRQLSLNDGPIDAEDYKRFLVDTNCSTQEMTFWRGDQLVAVAISDLGDASVSLVYCYFDPGMSRYSLGTYSILKHIQWASARECRYVYLGMYVADNVHLSYKARFQPQQRLCDGQWIAFDR